MDFFESLDRINRSIQGKSDLETMLSDVLETTLSIMDSDRAWLFFPCDPKASTWRITMERTRHGFPGALAMGIDFPMAPEILRVVETVSATANPVTFGPGAEYPMVIGPVGPVEDLFSVKSMIAMAVYPKDSQPYMFGLHQCSRVRTWTGEEKRLFQEIGRRFSDGLTGLLAYRWLQENELRYRQIFENASDLFVVWAVEDAEEIRIQDCNPAWEKAMGLAREAISGKGLPEILVRCGGQEIVGYYRQCLQTKKPVTFETELQPGSERLFIKINLIPVVGDGGKIGRLIEVGHDLTERRRAEAEREKLQAKYLQAQKLESIGRLAGGIAHDFNNMLGVILGHVDLATREIDQGRQIQDSLREIQKAATRSADLTRQLLAFARKQTVAPRVIDLNEIIPGMLTFLRRLIGENIKLEWFPEKDLHAMKIDPTQIDQVLVNLCANARDAISGIGKITIETRNIFCPPEFTASRPDFAPGEYVLLTVSDNGCGMDKATLANIFEPFFTTKNLGQGTGLGLATVFGIAMQNHGFINVYSEPGLGTTFKIYFPRHSGEIPDKANESGGTGVTFAGKTILLVEDEPSYLDTIRNMLEMLHLHVLAAGTPRQAIELVKGHSGEVHLLLTDVIMPEMNGRELHQALLTSLPGLRCLFMSGYTANLIAHHGVLEEGVNFLQKPFQARNLAEKIAEALNKN